MNKAYKGTYILGCQVNKHPAGGNVGNSPGSHAITFIHLAVLG